MHMHLCFYLLVHKTKKSASRGERRAQLTGILTQHLLKIQGEGPLTRAHPCDTFLQYVNVKESNEQTTGNLFCRILISVRQCMRVF